MNKDKIRTIVETRETTAGRIFDFVVVGAIALSAALFVAETVPQVSDPLGAELAGLLMALSCLFLLEYIARLWVAHRKIAFVFSFWGLVDLVAIAPLFFSLFDISLNLIVVRMLRLLRLFSLFKAGRYSRSLKTFAIAFGLAKEQLLVTLCAAFLVIFVASAGIYQFEHSAQPQVFTTFFDALWWSVATLTTVGYGDIYPITAGGKIFTSLVLFAGLGVVALPAGIVAAALSRARENHEHQE